MPVARVDKKELAALVPHGLVVTRSWLMEKGLGQHSIDNLVKSGQLASLVHGVYARPETKLHWQGIVCSLQRMGVELNVGGLSALELQSLGHYLSLSDRRIVHLYGSDKLPSWTNKLLPQVRFQRHRPLLSTAKAPGYSTVELTWGDDSWPLTVSAPEAAFLEVLMDVPDKISFEHADQLMQGLFSLSPRRLQRLLANSRNVKVNRLFCWFSDRHRHPWHKKLVFEDVYLGKGKRVLAKDGKFDTRYQITVPGAMHG